ncbi:MAG: PspC domain-containing protein [Gammaproteobacteria bacterium]
MNPDFFERLLSQVRRLYRDRDNGLFLGVCAGMADAFRWPIWGVRLTALLLLVTVFLPTVLVYVTAGLLLPGKRLEFHGNAESRFWKRRPGSSQDRNAV